MRDRRRQEDGHGPPARARSASPSRARAADDLHRRPHPLPAPDREAGEAHRRGPHPHRVGRLHLLRLRVAPRRRAAPRLGEGRGAGRGRRARPGAQRVPHRRRLRLAALRLRPPARRGHEDASPRRASASSSTCGATRAGASASATSCGPTSSRSRATTRSTPTSTSACPSTAGSTASAPRSSSTSASPPCGYMTNNPAKYGGLEGFGLEIVERVPLESVPNPENIGYLRTKRERMGHLLTLEGSEPSRPCPWRTRHDRLHRPAAGRRPAGRPRLRPLQRLHHRAPARRGPRRPRAPRRRRGLDHRGVGAGRLRAAARGQAAGRLGRVRRRRLPRAP